MFKITIGVPIWNQNMNYFRKCLESIKAQSYQNFECIILDDGSDNPEEVEKMTNEFGFKYIYQENQGIGGARKSIVDNASKESEFVCFLSSDDIWDEKFLEVMIKESEQHPNKILYSSNYHIDREGKIIFKFVPLKYENHEDFCIASWEMAYRNTMMVNFSALFFPKKVFEKLKFNKNLRYGEDLDFLLRSMRDFEYYLVNQLLLYYRAMDNTTSRRLNEIPKNNEKIRKECMEYWKNG